MRLLLSDRDKATPRLVLQPMLKAKLEDSRYNIAMENHEFGVAPEAFTKWLVLNDTYDILSTSNDRSVLHIKLPF